MHVMLIPIGSAGDVHPFVGLGLALRGRGHQVTIVTNGYFEPLVRRLGLDFVSLGTAEEFLAITQDPALWHPQRGFLAVAQHLVRGLKPVYEAIASRYVPGETVVGAATLALGARIAQEKLGVPTATLHLQPIVFRSVHQPPRIPLMYMPDWAPHAWKKFLFWLADILVIDRALAPETNVVRAELGLPPVRRLFDKWMHSPRRVIGLFPDWFASLQPDWPAQTRLTGFPLYDESGLEEASSEAREFLDAGDAPVVFTPGSAMRHGRDFFEAAAEACRLLGRRGLLLTRFPEQLPDSLPEGVRHLDYVPFSQLLPRSAALVHHGGIGTMAQALAAGVPQLIMPMSHDQPDNAARVQRLGVGDSLPPSRFRSALVARKLKLLLESRQVAASCRSVAQRFRDDDALDQTCRLLEELVDDRPEKSN